MGSWIWVKVATPSFGKKKFEKHQLNFVEQTTSKLATKKKILLSWQKHELKHYLAYKCERNNL